MIKIRVINAIDKCKTNGLLDSKYTSEGKVRCHNWNEEINRCIFRYKNDKCPNRIKIDLL